MVFRPFSKPASIFLVDDEPLVCKALSQTLREISCKVRTFTRPKECLETLRRSKCDLLISDVSMPDMNGVELLEAVKQIMPQLPVLLITGYGEIAIAVKAVKAGAYDFIEKPLDEETFLPKVQEALEQSHGLLSSQESLTKTEDKVLQLIVDGKVNKEIARMLECSTRTVENHRYRLMRKLNVNSTASLVRRALTEGLVGK